MGRVAELEEHLKVLTEFERDYWRYIEAQMQGEDPDALRSQLLRRASRASRALAASGYNLTLTPPPMLGGPIVTDLGSQLFAHETPTYGSGPDPFYAPRLVLDSIGQAIGSLEDRLEQARANPSLSSGRSAKKQGRHRRSARRGYRDGCTTPGSWPPAAPSSPGRSSRSSSGPAEA